VRHLEGEDDVVGRERLLGRLVVAEALDALASLRAARSEPRVLAVTPILNRGPMLRFLKTNAKI
jgi:hypothetical protein